MSVANMIATTEFVLVKYTATGTGIAKEEILLQSDDAAEIETARLAQFKGYDTGDWTEVLRKMVVLDRAIYVS